MANPQALRDEALDMSSFRAASWARPQGTVARGAVARGVQEVLRGDRGAAQFARFVVVGGVSTLLYGTVFLLLADLGTQAANLIGAVLSTMLANEMHRRLTFRAGDRVGWFTAQWEGGGLAALGLVASSLTLAGLSAALGQVPALTQVAMVVLVTGIIGAGRFVALRWWVFGRRRTA